MKRELWREGSRQTHAQEELLLMIMEVHTKTLNVTQKEKDTLKTFLMFTFVVKIHPKQTIIHTCSGTKVH